MSRRSLHYCCCWLALILNISAVQAGSKPASKVKLDPNDIAGLSKLIETTAAARGARVFVIARRSGTRDLPEAIRYTHTAIAVYSQSRTGDGRTLKTYAIHNLYQNPDQVQISSLEQDYAFDFMAGASTLEAGLLIPSPELQRKLLDAILAGYPQSIHEQRYSAIANPHDPEFQNCTEFVLDLINAAIYETTDRQELKQIARDWFTPTPLKVSSLKLTLASMVAGDIRTSDHHGSPKTATFGSLATYLEANNMLSARIDLRW